MQTNVFTPPNASALLKSRFPNTGYLQALFVDGKELVLVPSEVAFPASVLHSRKGVCGEAAYFQETVVVGDVRDLSQLYFVIMS